MELVDNFNIQLVEDNNFPSESQENFPEIKDIEKNFQIKLEEDLLTYLIIIVNFTKIVDR